MQIKIILQFSLILVRMGVIKGTNTDENVGARLVEETVGGGVNY